MYELCRQKGALETFCNDRQCLHQPLLKYDSNKQRKTHYLSNREKLHYCTSFTVVYKRNTYTGQQTISKDTGYYLIFLQCLSQDICKEKLIKYSASHLKITFCDDVHTEWG